MIGVAVIGCGIISKQHVQAYLQFPKRCELKMLYDLDIHKSEALKKELGHPELETVNDIHEVLKCRDIQLVSICTPPYTHEKLAVQCLQAGKHVLVEKPMAASLEECDRMIEAQEASGCYLGVVSQNRYREEYWRLKQLLDSGRAGRVLFGQAESFWFRGQSYYDVDWRGTWEKEGGGCTLNHGVHQIDLLNWMMGRPKTVTAVMENTAHYNSQLEDVSAAVLTYENGAVVTMTTSLVNHKEGQRIRFQCEEAAVSAPWEIECSSSKPDGFPVADEERKHILMKFYDSLPSPDYEGHKGQIDSLLSFLEGGMPVHQDRMPTHEDGMPAHQDGTMVHGNGQDGRLAIEVIMAMYQSAFTGRTVTLPLEKDSLYYTKESFLKNVKDFQRKGK